MDRRLNFLWVLFMLFIMSGCHCIKDDSPVHNSSSLDDLVLRSCSAWLNVRMGEEEWLIFSSEDAVWRTAETVSPVIQWFQDEMPSPELWEFDKLLHTIYSSSLYIQNTPTDQQLMMLIKVAFLSFEYFYEG